MDEATKHKVMVMSGMGALMVGAKLPALAMFAKGAMGLEDGYRKDNNFEGTWSERWERAITFYGETHEDKTNRLLHIVGIPMIAGGAVGMLTMPSYSPPWALSAASFAAGWALNFVGHGVYEKKEPAFFTDPLSFIAGPVWDVQQVFGRFGKKGRAKGAKLRPVPSGEASAA